MDKTSNHSIYAIWNANTYTVTFDANHGNFGTRTEIYTSFKNTTQILGGGVSIPVVRTSQLSLSANKDYILEFMHKSDGNNQFNVDFYPDTLPEINPTTNQNEQWTTWLVRSESTDMGSALVRLFNDKQIPNPYNIYIYNINLYECNGCTLSSTSNVTYGSTYGTLPIPTRSGYTFNGWYTTGGVKIESTTTVSITSNQTLYAQWTANTYTVTFDSAGGSTVSSKTVTYGSTYGDLPTPTRSEYYFAGWYTSDQNRMTYSSKVSTAANHTLTARWVKTVTTFAYTGSAQTYTVATTGTYKLEVWGAQGGNYSDSCLGGKGGYSSGNVSLEKSQVLYVYVGSQGSQSKTGGYNGGGGGNHSEYCVTGGGATHIATASGILSSLENNKSAILIVAGGGGGAGTSYQGSTYCLTAGYGGGTTGGNGAGKNGSSTTSTGLFGYGGTQTAGGSKATGYGDPGSGTFGQGGSSYRKDGQSRAGAGGGGFYGGGGGYTSNTGAIAVMGSKYQGGSGGGGAGYISSSLTSTTILAGNQSFSAPNGGSETGHSGNGYAKITFVSE